MWDVVCCRHYFLALGCQINELCKLDVWLAVWMVRMVISFVRLDLCLLFHVGMHASNGRFQKSAYPKAKEHIQQHICSERKSLDFVFLLLFW